MVRGVTIIQELAKAYADNFFTFVKGHNIAITVEECYYLIDYAICSIYEIPCSWYTDGIRMYGQMVINHLNLNVKACPMLNYEDRVSLVSLSNTYLVAIFQACGLTI